MEAEKEKIVRSRTVSFRDIHIAKVTTNTETEYAAETPSKLARAITGKISDEFETEKIYSDDSVEDVNMSYKGTSVELEVNSLAPQDKSQVFGHLYEKGFLIKTKDDKAPELALGWRAKKLNGKYEFKWLYCGRFGQGFEDNYETEGETKTTQTATLKGDFYARQMDGRYECSVDESNLLTEHTEAAAAIKDWFSKVQEKPDAKEMAAAKTKKRSIIIGNKEYTMPQKMSTMAYLRYLEVRDSIMDTEAKRALYTRQQFMDMMDVIVEMYGNQFTTDDMLDAETGMTPDSIVMEFALMDVSVGEKVDKRTEDFAKNFTNGK